MSDHSVDRLKSMVGRAAEAQALTDEMAALIRRLEKITRKVTALKKNPKGKGAMKALTKLGEEALRLDARMDQCKARHDELTSEGQAMAAEAPAPRLSIPVCPHCGGSIEGLLQEAHSLGARAVAEQVLLTARPLLISLRAGGDAVATLVGALETVVAGQAGEDKAH